MSGRGISSVALCTLSSGAAGGGQFPISSTIPCQVLAYPGDTGAGGGAVNATSNGSGVITGFTVVTAGDYDYPPMIAPLGAWTNDGIHGSPVLYDQIISQCGIGPQLFTI